MKPVKRTDQHLIYRKRNQRYAVRRRSTKEWVRGEDKVAVLLANGLIDPPSRKPTEEAPAAEEAPAEAAAEAAAAEGPASEEGAEGAADQPES